MSRHVRIYFTRAIRKVDLFCLGRCFCHVRSRSGVASRIQPVFPNVIIWHCMNHRLELAVGDAIHEVSGTNHFKAFFDKLYCLYYTYSKNRRELEEVCNDLACIFHTVGRILNTRWVASSFRTVKVVWDLYVPLHAHLVKAGEDQLRSRYHKGNRFHRKQGTSSSLIWSYKCCQYN